VEGRRVFLFHSRLPWNVATDRSGRRLICDVVRGSLFMAFLAWCAEQYSKRGTRRQAVCTEVQKCKNGLSHAASKLPPGAENKKAPETCSRGGKNYQAITQTKTSGNGEFIRYGLPD
jgi:hypothetical protein